MRHSRPIMPEVPARAIARPAATATPAKGFSITIGGQTIAFEFGDHFVAGRERFHWTAAGIDGLIKLGLWKREIVQGKLEAANGRASRGDGALAKIDENLNRRDHTLARRARIIGRSRPFLEEAIRRTRRLRPPDLAAALGDLLQPNQYAADDGTDNPFDIGFAQ